MFRYTYIPFSILALLWGATEINGGGCGTPAKTLKAVDIASLGRCDSYFTNQADQVVCGLIDDQAAARLCYDTGINHVSDNVGLRREYRCIKHTDNNLAPLVPADMHSQIAGASNTGYGCDVTAPAGSGDPDCFLNCYPEVVAAITGATTCGGETMRTAVECEDIDECTEGVLRDCTGPFDFDCECGIPCGPGALCENTDGGYNCLCPDGYNAAGAGNIDIGCVDINECLTTAANDCDDGGAGTELCENTIGSYYCICKAFDGQFRDPTGGDCDVGMCDTADLPESPTPVTPGALDNSNGWTGDDEYTKSQTTVCDDGFEASLSDPMVPVRTECRNDGQWCQCNPLTCQRKKCGLPHHDGNANVNTVEGVTGDLLKYNCLDGFKAGPDASYSILCENSGVWEGVDLRCTDDDECSDSDICDGYSDCINTVGSYHCHCHPGFEGDDCMDRISCGEIPIVAHAERLSTHSSENGYYEDVVNYRCEEGYHVSTNHNPHEVERDFDITCKLDECWTPSPIPHCVPISCGDPGDLKHASREGASFYYKSKVSYTCYDGFELSGYYHTNEYNKVNTFEITCENDGWTDKQHCEDIDECKDYDHPCGVGGRHHCINRKGSYTCSCAPGFRLDKTGKQCIGLPTTNIEDIQDPCKVVNNLGFCKHGHCVLEVAGTPRCSCDTGYRGTYCDRAETVENSLAFVTAIVDLGIGGLSLIVCILLACCVCSRNHPRGHRRHGPVLHHPKHVVAPPPMPPVYARQGLAPTPFQSRFQAPFKLGFIPQLRPIQAGN